MKHWKRVEERLRCYQDLSVSVRLDQEAMLYGNTDEEAKRRLERNMQELTRLTDAVTFPKEEEYGELLVYKYRDGIPEEQIAEILNCDISTIRRHKRHFLKRAAVRLYGCEAIEELCK